MLHLLNWDAAMRPGWHVISEFNCFSKTPHNTNLQFVQPPQRCPFHYADVAEADVDGFYVIQPVESVIGDGRGYVTFHEVKNGYVVQPTESVIVDGG